MSANPNALEEITRLQKQVEDLRQAAVEELKFRRAQLERELSEVDHELVKLTGNGTNGKRRGRPSRPILRVAPPLEELESRLAKQPDLTLNVRKDGLDLAHIKSLAAQNPDLLRLGGKAPWPTVTLLRPPQI